MSSLKLVILGSLVFALIVGLFIYGVTNRPLIDYKLECPDSLSIYENSVPLPSLQLNFKNRGGTDSPILIVIKSENVTIEPQNKKPYVEFDNHSIKYLYTMTAGSKETPYSKEIVYLKTNKSIEGFSISMVIEKKFQITYSGLFSLVFGESKGFYPTECIYLLKDESSHLEFELIQ